MILLFKYETHTHSSEASACATNDILKMLKKYHSLGYTGIILTNHFFNGNTCVPRNMPWESKIELFFSPYEKAKIKAKEYDMDVFFGLEYNYYATEFLVFGIDKTFLLSHPEIMSLPLADFCNLVHKNNGFIVHAHPYREAPYISEIRLFPELVDAVEVINGSHAGTDFDEKAKQYSSKYNLLETAGSDAHNIKHSMFCGMEFEHRLKDINDFISSVKKREYSLFLI